MSQDPYSKYLKIPSGQRPPTASQVLGIPDGTTDIKVIEAAAEQRLDQLDEYALSNDHKVQEQVQELMNQVAKARAELIRLSQQAVAPEVIAATGDDSDVIDPDDWPEYRQRVRSLSSRKRASKERQKRDTPSRQQKSAKERNDLASSRGTTKKKRSGLPRALFTTAAILVVAGLILAVYMTSSPDSATTDPQEVADASTGPTDAAESTRDPGNIESESGNPQVDRGREEATIEVLRNDQALAQSSFRVNLDDPGDVGRFAGKLPALEGASGPVTYRLIVDAEGLFELIDEGPGIDFMNLDKYDPVKKASTPDNRLKLDIHQNGQRKFFHCRDHRGRFAGTTHPRSMQVPFKMACSIELDRSTPNILRFGVTNTSASGNAVLDFSLENSTLISESLISDKITDGYYLDYQYDANALIGKSDTTFDFEFVHTANDWWEEWLWWSHIEIVNSGLFVVDPNKIEPGTYSVVIEASDGQGLISQRKYSVEVIGKNSTPAQRLAELDPEEKPEPEVVTPLDAESDPRGEERNQDNIKPTVADHDHQLIAKVRRLSTADAAPDSGPLKSVGISGSLAVVGAGDADTHVPKSGSISVFDANTGKRLHTLVADDAKEEQRFGYASEISGQTVIVGARGDDHAGESAGAAYLFDANTGRQLYKLTAEDAKKGDQFGYSVGIGGDVAIVGAWANNGREDNRSESAYLFDTKAGKQLFRFAIRANGLGMAVATDGKTAVVGAPGDDHAGTHSGSVYVFDVETGRLKFRLAASDAGQLHEFGYSVAIDGEILVVGTRRKGVVYLFDTQTGQQTHRLSDPDSDPSKEFGGSVSIQNQVVIVGGVGSKTVYLYDAMTGEHLASVHPTDDDTGGGFGQSVAFSNGKAIVGSSNSEKGFYLYDVFARLNEIIEDPERNHITSNHADPQHHQITRLLRANKFDGTALSVATSESYAAVTAQRTGSNQKSVCIFDTTTGRKLHEFVRNDATEGLHFGGSIGISGQTVIIGSGHDLYNESPGAAYLYDAITGELLDKCIHGKGDESKWHEFGMHVAVGDDIAIIGSYDAAYLFNIRTGKYTVKLDVSGEAVATDGKIAIRGRPNASHDRIKNWEGAAVKNWAGSAVLFDIETGKQTFELVASDAATDDRFGYSVAVEGNTAVVGTWEKGAVYLFDTRTGKQTQKLLPPDNDGSTNFGRSISIQNQIVIVGGGTEAVYLYDAITGRQLAALTPAGGEVARGVFGTSVALSNGKAIVGSSFKDNWFADLYELNTQPGRGNTKPNDAEAK